jgi:hypothetical protein
VEKKNVFEKKGENFITIQWIYRSNDGDLKLICGHHFNYMETQRGRTYNLN